MHPSRPKSNGFKGQTIDFNVASTWDKLCPSDSDPFVLLLTDTGQPPGRALGYHPDERVRWTILDVRGTTVIARRASNRGGHGLRDGGRRRVTANLIDQVQAP